MLIIGIAIGSGIGAVLRYFIANYSQKRNPYLGTIIINAIGTFLAGFFINFNGVSNFWRTCIMVGVLAGFTTFATFMKDCLTLIQNKEWGRAAIYFILMVLIGFIVLFLGMYLGKIA